MSVCGREEEREEQREEEREEERGEERGEETNLSSGISDGEVHGHVEHAEAGRDGTEHERSTTTPCVDLCERKSVR
jgi:hypothetical protein